MRNMVGAPSPTRPITTAATHKAGLAVVRRTQAHGPMASIETTCRSLILPVLSASTPNKGEVTTASSMGKVLAKPESVGSMPSPCRNVGEYVSMEMSTMLNMRKPPRMSSRSRVNRLRTRARGRAASCGARFATDSKMPPSGVFRYSSSMAPAAAAMAAMTSHVPWKPTTPNREGVSTPPKNDPSDIHKAQMLSLIHI